MLILRLTAPSLRVAFGALLTRHPMAPGDFFDGVSANVTPWPMVHLGGAILFPAMALVVWLLIRDLSSRPATVARVALPVYAVFHLVFEAVMGNRRSSASPVCRCSARSRCRRWARPPT